MMDLGWLSAHAVIGVFKAFEHVVFTFSPTFAICFALIPATIVSIWKRTTTAVKGALIYIAAVLFFCFFVLWPLHYHLQRETGDWDGQIDDYWARCERSVPKSNWWRQVCIESQGTLFHSPFEIALQKTWRDLKAQVTSFWFSGTMWTMLAIAFALLVGRSVVHPRLSRIRRSRDDERRDRMLSSISRRLEGVAPVLDRITQKQQQHLVTGHRGEDGEEDVDY